MSEQITHSDTTTPTAELRRQIEAVRDRHRPQYWRSVGLVCMECSTVHTATANGHPYVHDESELISSPCDAHILASALLAAVDKLEWYADESNWQGGMPMYHHFVPDSHFGPEENELRADMGDIARAALATIAAKLNGADDAR